MHNFTDGFDTLDLDTLNGLLNPSFFKSTRFDRFPAVWTKHIAAWPAQDENFTTDVSKDGQTYTLALDVPGVKKADLKVTFSNHRLLVTGKRGEKNIDHEFKIPTKWVSPKSKLEDGVLTVTFQIAPAAKETQVVID